jgi:hypothetical protein
MNQRIGNVGLLNLMNATEESIKGIEKIENVGMVLYRKENAYLLSHLNIGNIGASVELPEGYDFYNGILTINQAYLQSIKEPVKLFVNGLVIVERDVQADQFNPRYLHIVVNGKVYVPSPLSGIASLPFSKGVVETYEGMPPRFVNGELNLTNSFLNANEEALYLVVNGVLSFSKDLNMDVFSEKVQKLEVNGKITAYEEQAIHLYKKIASLTTCMVELIPEGFEVIKKPLRVNSRSIRRFQNKKLYTKKPIFLEADITREIFETSIPKIHSSSMIICHEQLEDLVYECCSLLDTEVLTYEHNCILITGEEVWSNHQFLSLENPINLIVEGRLVLDSDVQPSTFKEYVKTVDILGKVVVSEKTLMGSLYPLIRLNTGSFEEPNQQEEGAILKNVGELSL